MSATVYNILTTILLGASLLPLLVAISFLVAALVGWRTPFRKRRFVWSGGLFAATLGTIAAQQALLWWGFLLAFGREMREQAREQREQAVALSTLTKIGDVGPEFSVVADDGSSVEKAHRQSTSRRRMISGGWNSSSTGEGHSPLSSTPII